MRIKRSVLLALVLIFCSVSVTGAVARYRVGSDSHVDASAVDSGAFTKVLAGTVGAPAYTTVGDTDTGMWFPSANNVGISVGAFLALTMDVNGNHILSSTLDAATGNEEAFRINYTVNKATSGNDTGLVINQTDTASPGTSNILDLRVANVSVFTVDTTGTVTTGDTAPKGATYITQTSNSTLTAEQPLDALSSGIMRVANATGVITALTDSAGIAANISDETGTNLLVFNTNASLITPDIGVATGTSLDLNGILDMSDNEISDVGYIDFNLINGVAQLEGRMVWNEDDGTLNVGMKGGVVNLQVGQEQLVRGTNKTGVTITDGMATRISGASGNKPEFGLAEADVLASAGTIGLATEDIANNAQGYVTTHGLVRDLDTTGTPVGETWLDANRLYVSNTSGELTNVAPISDERKIFIGIVLNAHATQGIIWVSPINTSYLRELSGNNFSTETQYDHVEFNGTVWENVSAMTIAGANISTSDITLKDGTPPTVDGRIEYDTTLELIQVGDDGVATLDFYPNAHTTDTHLTQEEVEDFAGALITDGTGIRTGISVVYQDSTADVDFIVDHDTANNFVSGEHYLQSAIVETGIIATGVWNGTSIADANVDNNITLDNITQITTKSHASLTDIGSNTHAQIDTHLADTSDPHGVTLTQTNINIIGALDATAATSTIPTEVDTVSTPTVEGMQIWNSTNDVMAVGDAVGTGYFAKAASDGDALAGDTATGFFDAGTTEHERGGLEADINAYDGLIGITGGTTYNQTFTDTQIVIGDGAGAPTSAALSGDVGMTNGGVVSVNSVQPNAVALSTDTTGNYVATLADAGNSTITVANSGSEGAAVTVDLTANGVDDTHIDWGTGANQVSLDDMPEGDSAYYTYNSWNGTIKEMFDATISSDGVTVTMSIEKSGTGDLTYQFSSGTAIYDCTPADTITLTVGTDISPQSNWIYLLQTAPTTLVKSTSSWPSAEHIKIAYFFVQSAASVQADGGTLINQNWNNMLAGSNGQGHITHISQKLRHIGPTYFSGVDGNGATASYYTISASNTEFLSTSGVVEQLHAHTFPAFSTPTNTIHVVNSSVSAYRDITDLFSITTDSTGATITNNKYFNLVIWGVINKSGEHQAVMVNVPDGFYNSQADAENDVLGYDNFAIPREFSLDSSNGFLIARTTFQMGATWTHVSTVDLRGTTPQSASGGASGVATSFPDSTFDIFGNLDNTKMIVFDVDTPITTGTTRTLSPLDKDYTIGDMVLASPGNLAGAWNMGSQNLTNVNIDSGTLDGITTLQMPSGDIGATGARITKGWFTDLEVTNAIAGSITGNAATVTTNANLTGPITSVGNATSIAAQTGTGSTFVMSVSPNITSPVIGDATGSSIILQNGTFPAFFKTTTSDDIIRWQRNSGSPSNVWALLADTASTSLKDITGGVTPMKWFETGDVTMPAGDFTITGDINPEADGTRDLGTQTTAQWANVWSDLVNGADYGYDNGWRTLEADTYAGYGTGIAFDFGAHFVKGKAYALARRKTGATKIIKGINEEGVEVDKVVDVMERYRPIHDRKPTFAVTNDFIEFKGRRLTAEMLDKLIALVSAE